MSKKVVKKKRVSDKEPKLSAKQLRFCQEFMIDSNASQAAIRAGYSSKNPNVISDQIMRFPHVKAKIAEMQAELAEKFKINAEWVLQRFVDISNRCMEAEPVLDRDGMPTGVYQFDSSGANKATEQIGKHLGFFAKDNRQKSEVVLKDLSKMSEGELDAMIVQLKNKA